MKTFDFVTFLPRKRLYLADEFENVEAAGRLTGDAEVHQQLHRPHSHLSVRLHLQVGKVGHHHRLDEVVLEQGELSKYGHIEIVFV